MNGTSLKTKEDTSEQSLQVKTCLNTASEAGSLDSDEELALLALLDEEPDPNSREELSVGTLTGDEASEEDIQLLETLMQDLQTEENTETRIQEQEEVHEEDNLKQENQSWTNLASEKVVFHPDHHLDFQNSQPMRNFEEDIAFFDQLGADQDGIEDDSRPIETHDSNSVETIQDQPPFLNIGPPSTTTENPDQIPDSNFLPMSYEQDPIQQPGRTFVPEASFSPVMYFDQNFTNPAQDFTNPAQNFTNHNQNITNHSQGFARPDQNWYSYEHQTAPVVMAEQQLENSAQMVEVFPRLAQGKSPCSLLVFGIGGQSFTSYNGGTSIGISNFTELALYLKSKNQTTTGGFVPALNEDGVSMKDLGIEQNIGPLTPATNREKVLKFLSDRMESSHPDRSSDHDLSLIWSTLAILARNRGQLTVKTPEGEATDPDVIEMLTVKDPGESGLNHGALPGLKDVQIRNQFDQQHITAQIQQALLYGKQKEALELAKEGGMWALAIALSHSLDPVFWTQTLEEMTNVLLYDGPLKTHFLLLAGKTASSSTPTSGVKPMLDNPSNQGNETVNVFTPDYDPLLVNWRSTLAMLIANRLPGFREMMIQLGDKLWRQRHEVYAAHLCYLLAAVVPQSLTIGQDCRMALLGADHRTFPNHFITIDAIQRTEILEWILTNGKPNRRLICVLPFKLHLARLLAEYGRVSEGIQYCEVILETMKSASSRLPKELGNCKYQTIDLLSQLKTHAESFGINVQRQTTLLKKMGDFLDKGINRLIGVSEAEDEVYRAPPSSDGVAMSEVQSFKKSSSMASLGSSTTGGSVSLATATQHNQSPIRQSQNWFHRMLGGRPSINPVVDPIKPVPSVEAIPDYPTDTMTRPINNFQPLSNPGRSDPALEFEDVRL